MGVFLFLLDLKASKLSLLDNGSTLWVEVSKLPWSTQSLKKNPFYEMSTPYDKPLKVTSRGSNCEEVHHQNNLF